MTRDELSMSAISDDKVIGVVLAGGEGKRLRPLTYYFQKCMIPIGNRQKPLLEYILLHLKRHGISNIKLLVGYKHDQIINYFNNGNRFDLNVEYFLDDPSLGGSGGAILNAANQGAFHDANILLVNYGDIISDINIKELIKQHIESGSMVTLAVTKGFKVPVGVAKLLGKCVVYWEEKPTINIYAGIGIVALSPKVVDILKEFTSERNKIDIMGELIPFIINSGQKVEAYITDAFWYDVGSTEKYEKIDNGLIDKILDI